MMTTTGNVHESSTRQSSNEPPQAPPTGDMNGGYAFDDADEAESFAQEYQNTSFTINEYYSIGQVANLVNDNGANLINMTLTVNGTESCIKMGVPKRFATPYVVRQATLHVIPYAIIRA